MKNELQQTLDVMNETVATFVTNQKSMQRQLDAIDLSIKDRAVGFIARESLVDKLKAVDGFNRLITDRRGSATLTLKGQDMALLQRKTTILASGQGFMTTGVMPIDRIPGITPEARQVLQVRDVLTSNPTVMTLVDFVRVQSPMTIASPVPEGSTKPENALSFVSLSEKVRTIATWIPASKQILDDMSELANFINTSIPYYVNLAEELQLLSGDATGENLHGLIPQAMAFDKTQLAAGATKIDVIGCAIEQIEVAKELQPTFAILHPSDWWSMKLLKDSLGRYILGDPQSTTTPRIFDLDVIPTTSIAKGSFLVGSGNPAASEIRDRMEMQVEVSTEHANFFTQNLVAVRGEKRLALVVKRPNSYVTGTFTNLAGSPLSARP
jgi:HK97 family phage major capsid protein